MKFYKHINDFHIAKFNANSKNHKYFSVFP